MADEERNQKMNRIKTLLLCILIALLFALPEIVSAQRIIPAAGSLDSVEDGLWIYYRGKSKSTVKRNAPLFEKISGSNSYLLDYRKIKGVELYLTAEFTNSKLVLLQILTPFPEYDSCKKDTKDMAKSFAEVGFALMGVDFKSKQCKQSKDNGGTMVCTAEDFVCVYRLCPEQNWALACSELGEMIGK